MLSPILFALAAAATPDTVAVQTAVATEPYALLAPYQTEERNFNGKTFDLKDALADNERLATADVPTPLTLRKGDALGGGDYAALRVIKFSLTAERFTKVKLDVKTLANHKVFIDGIDQTGKDILLEPGKKTVTMLALTKKEDKDSFNVSIIGEHAAALTVNAEGKHPYTMADMSLGENIYSVSLSRKGTYLITSYYSTKPDGSGVYRTVLTETKSGKELRRVEGVPSWKWLANREAFYFTRNAAKGKELVTFDPTTGREEIMAQGLPEGSYTLSPNEDYIIINKSTNGDNDKTPSLKRLRQPDDRMPGWRSRNSLYKYDFKTHALTRLTFGEQSVWLNDISSDGRSLLLSFNRFDPTKAPFDRKTLVRMDVATAKVDTLLCDTTFISNAKFTPDGTALLISASPAAFGGIGAEVKAGQTPQAFDYRLYLYDIAAKKATPLLPGFAPSVGSYLWAKGDGNIYFKATDGCNESLFRLNPKTLRVEKIQLPVSVVESFSISSDERTPRLAFKGQTGERAREMFLCTLSSATPKCTRIGEVNFDRIAAEAAIGTCHDWAFKSSRGDSINGFFFLPPNFDAAKKYPLLVYYYGGCTPTAKQLEFIYPLQVFAAQGYVVYVCEPSGCIGYGQEFAARHVGTWGKESGDDIIEGTKTFLAEHPYVDAKRVGCMGASYGGFMTQYLQTRTDIFAAAVSHAGISNIASYWGGGYWGYSYGECAQYGSYPWNNPDMYVKQSPLFNADKIHTPLLLLHGTVDTNVPTTESQQLFNALRILGREVSYVQVDGENHVIGNFKKRMTWQSVIFAWFAKYLKGEPEWWNELYPENK